MFLYFLSSGGEGAGAGQVEKRINSNALETPNSSEERRPRHDFQTNVAKLKAFFCFRVFQWRFPVAAVSESYG